MRFRGSLPFVLAVLLTVLASAAPASAGHSWGAYHWARTQRAFTLELGDNSTTGAWSSILASSAADWSAAKVLDTVPAAGMTNSTQGCRPTLGRVEVCNGTYGEQLWVGIAQIWLDPAGHIIQGTVRNNDSYLNNSKYPRYNTYEAQRSVMCQEIGHTLGLDHQDEDFFNESLGTCMDYSVEFGINLQPDRHDYQQLSTIYNHADETTTVAATDGAIGGEFTPSRGQRGAVNRYVHELGNGYRLVTWVIGVE